MNTEQILIRGVETLIEAPGRVRAGPVDILLRDGRIAAVGPALAEPQGATVVEGRGLLAAPGLVNAHWHSPMQLSHGTSDRLNHQAFMWENQVDTANRSAEEIYASAVIGCLQMLKSGTTAVIDHFPEQGFGPEDVAAVVRAYRDCGMRAVVALRIFDGEYADILPAADRVTPALAAALAANNPLAPRPLAETLDIVRGAIEAHNRTENRIRIFPGPSNPVRCSDALLLASQAIAEEYDTGVHCHLLETRVQAELASARYGRTMVEHLDAIGAFGRRWSNAHCNWLSDAEIAIMARRGAVAVLNPESNLKIGSGIPPIPRLLAAGVPCALGNDGASTNDNLILQDAMQLAAILHRPSEPDRRNWVTVADVMAMATTGGAAAMLEPELGRLEPGCKADLVLYDLAAPWWVPLNDPRQQFVFGERGGSVRTVIVDGRLVVRDGRALLVDEEACSRAARHILPAVRARNGRIAQIAFEVAALQ